MARAPLKLVGMDPVNRDVLPFERRQSPRRLITGRVTSLQKTGHESDSRSRICSLQMFDISDTGLGGIVEQPVQIGAAITVFCSPHGTENNFVRYGHVVSCTACDNGYRIGIRLVRKCAA